MELVIAVILVIILFVKINSDKEAKRSACERFDEKQRKIYTSCAEYLTDLAQSKHPDRDYTEMRKLCRDGEHSPGAECAETV